MLLGSTLSAAAAGPPVYNELLATFWGKLYRAGGHTLYCDQAFGARHGPRINMEHVFPMAWAVRALGCEDRRSCRARNPQFRRIEADLHNLFPARTDLNRARGSMSFGMIAGERRRFGRCDFEVDEGRRRVEPRPAVRGDIARAMFYMHDRYDLKIFRRAARQLQRWHREDPPDRGERRRNERIEKLQGNRNRFIDDPAAVGELHF